MKLRKKYSVLALIPAFVVAVGVYLYLKNANNAELDPRWQSSVENNQTTIDHDTWQSVLDDYLVTDTDSGVNLFDYAGLIDDGRETLDDYIEQLVTIDPLGLNRLEQKAYWINLYNAATVQLIVDNYPVSSITTLGSGVTSFGPWDDIAVEVNGIELSLNDIEHRIIRPLYNDYRIHFAVNCASIGCPNLAPEVFTASDMDRQLDTAAAEYMTHPRGLAFIDKDLHLSSLFKWYGQDFGENQAQILSTLGQYISAADRALLASYQGEPSYDYDWSLNGYCQVDDACAQ